MRGYTARYAWALIALVGLQACSVGSEREAAEAADVEFLDPAMPDPDPSDEHEEGEDDDGIDPAGEGTKGGDASVVDDASDPPDDSAEPPVEVTPDDASAPADASAPLDAPAPPDVSTAPDVIATPDGSTAPDAALPPVATPPVTPPRFTVAFSSRDATNAADTTVERAIIDLVRRALPGSRLRAAMFSFTRYGAAAELINAYRRGVDVRVVLDGNAATAAGSEGPRLVAALGRDRVTFCGAPGTSCVGTGIMHDKFFTFTGLNDGSVNVVAVASHNLTNAQLRMHNNVVIARNDLGLLRAYERTFADMERDIVARNYYRIEDGDVRTRAYFFPRADGDTIVSILENVRCDSASRIRVAMAFFTNARIEVARSLAQLRRDGCSVSVVVGNAAIPIGRTVLSTLRDAGVRVTLYPRRTSGWQLHSKYLLVDAPYAGSAGHMHLVFTGSHNYTGGALTANDENVLRVDDGAVFNAFLADWVRVRAAAARP